MAKKSFFSKLTLCNMLCLLLFLGLVYLLYNYMNTSLREGAVFTRQDNENWFVRPWDKFCIQTPTSCQKRDEKSILIDGNPPIGCWCDNQRAPLLENKCTDLEFDPFIEYRR